jgi:hypothetical protein
MSTPMSAFEHCRRHCQIGARALHAISNSLHAFSLMQSTFAQADHLNLTAHFSLAVISYTKPFTRIEAPGGRTVKYPTRHLKTVNGFSRELHAHLLALRHALLAHDDLTFVEPKLLTISMRVPPSNVSIPMSISITTKSISHPAHLADIEKLAHHVTCAREGVAGKLGNDIIRLRKLTIDYPDQAELARRYEGEPLGTFDVPAEGASFTVPQYSNNEWLKVEEPKFSEVQGGFQYLEMQVRKDFYGPEQIELPGGDVVHITPHMLKGEA